MNKRAKIHSPAVPTVLASWLRVLLKAVDDNGGSSDVLLNSVGLTRDEVADWDARVSVNRSANLWNAAAEYFGDPALGLWVARYVRQTTFHALGYAFMASETLADALRRLVEFSVLVSDSVELALEENGSNVDICWYTEDPYRPAEPSMEAIMSLVLRSCRKIRGARFSPDAVWLTREQPLNTSVYEAFFGCPVSFGSGVYKMRFQRADVDAPLPWGNVELAIANDRIVQQHLAKLNTASVTQRLNALLVRELHTGLRTQADCARALGMSVRSLQRSLSDEQTSFREVLELVRYSLAERYLRTEPRPSLTEIAFMLGFSESSSFSRAYSRWTGCPPSAVS